MKRWLTITLAALILVGAAVIGGTKPETVSEEALAGLVPNIEAGEQVFLAGGCASCHSAPDATRGTRLVLAGGRAFPSQFGTFYAPNISSDPENGLGRWTVEEFVNAVKFGTSPQGKHYYPVFPYGAYQRATLQDLVSLFAYLQTLPPAASQSIPHRVAFPFNVRAGLGIWKRLFNQPDWVLTTVENKQQERGRYLVEALGHCAECHTARNTLGGLDRSRWLAGAPNPVGEGRIPNITPAKLDWSDQDLLVYFTQGFKPDYDTVGGSMAEVVENLANLPEEDLRAIVAYLRAVPSIP